MANITLNQQKLIVEVESVEKLWMRKNRLEIPLAHVSGAAIDPEVANNPPWQKPDTGDIQYHEAINSGTFYQHGKRIFWDVTNPSQAVVVQLKDEEYAELVVQVDDPAAIVSQINQAIGGSARS